MPIYAYKCDSCGFAKDVLQKLSDAQLCDCPSCGAPTFKKQLTAAGFQLKGSGWYVTDFKGGNAPGPGAGEDKASDAAVPADSKTAPKAEAKAGSAPTEPAAAKKTEPSAGAAAKPASAPGPGTGSAS